MSYPIKFLVDKEGTKFIPYTNSQSVLIDGTETRLQDILDVKLDPADVKAGSNIKVTPGTDNTTVAWVRPTNLNVQDNLTTTAAGQGVLDARQGKLLLDNINTRILSSEKGKPNGVATLDGEGHVPSAQLPSYVDDIIEAYIRNGATGLSKEWLSLTEGGAALEPEKGKIYVIMSAGDWQNKQYRWGGSTYALCNPSDVNSVNGMTGVITLKTLTLKTAAGTANTINETYNAGTDKTVTINVPSKTSHITNDSGFITASASITGNAATATTADKTKGTLTIKMKNYDTNTETTDTFNGNADKTITIGVPTKVSQLTNDSQYITASASITGNAATATTASKTTGTLTIQRNGTTIKTFNGSSSQTANITVPTKVSELDNDSKFISSVPVASSTTSGTVKVGTGLAINTNGVLYVTGEGVSAASIDWDKINGKPSDVSYFNNDAGYITSSGNAATATTASKTTGTLTIQKNGTTVKTFNGSSNQTANITVPTKVSELTNDSAFITASASITGNAATATTASKTTGTLTIQKNGTNVDTFNGSANKTINITVPTNNNQLTNGAGYITSSGSITGNAATATSATKLGTTTIGSTSQPIYLDNGVPKVCSNLSASNYLPLAGGVMTGNIQFKTTNYTSTPVKVLDDTTTYGHTLLVGAGGRTFIGSGEAHTGLSDALGLSSSEDLFLVSDVNVVMYAGCQTVANRQGVQLTTAGNFHPLATNTQTLGTSSLKWNNVYATTFTGNATSASKLATARTITLTGSVTGSGSFDGSGDLSITTTTNHTHNYAGSASAGGAANSVKTNLVIKLNGGSTEGTNLFTFNGSTAKTVNITASGIGAAASSHTHNYAGSSSAGGAANSTKASLTLTKNGSNTVFNGGTAYTVTVPTVHTGTGVPAASLGQNGDIYIVTG